MRIHIEATSQDEFDSKRPELIKALAGSKLAVEVRPKDESRAGEPREPHYRAQKEMLAYWDERFQAMLKTLKADIELVLGESS